MSFLSRRWRALDAEYDIVDSWPILFITLTLALLISIPSLFVYTYAYHEDVSTYSYYLVQYSRHWYGLEHVALTHWQLWRVLTNEFVWGTFAEILVGSALIFCLHPLETQLASTRTRASLVLVSMIVLSAAYHTIIEELTDSVHVQPGPYWVFALIPFYWLSMQPSMVIKVSRLSVSDKWVVYMLALQLILVRVPESLVSAAGPLLIGVCYAAIQWCQGATATRMLGMREVHGMRVGRRDEPATAAVYVPSTPATAATSASSAPKPSSTSTASAAPPVAAKSHAPRPVSHYERLAANARGQSRSTASSPTAAAPRSAPAPADSVTVDVNAQARETSPLLGSR